MFYNLVTVLDSTPPTPQNLCLPWMEWKLGQRVVVRRREKDGLYDALGILLECTKDYVVIETRRGIVKVEAQKMVTGKVVGPGRK